MTPSGKYKLASHKPAHFDRMSQENQKSSILLRLPAELRNHVYNLLLDNFATARVIKPKVHIVTHPHTRKNLRGLILLFICRQTRSEAAVMFYTRTTFDFTSLWKDFYWAIEMLRIVGEDHWHLIRSIKLDLRTIWLMRLCPSLQGSASAPSSLLSSLRRVDVNMPSHWYRNRELNEQEGFWTESIALYFGKHNVEIRYLRY
ncbi:hypothetical protein T440DRAFT_232139 [Plenodomus tracheiphilus IPT5]|uniref:F-box domain-containing protein n=1 Tax=Plenodomus tracheiphilus IPT5 TaxID=1408161 RepID=A0A6A7ASS2_9PLEO|nr:hypothetical protein T440DRAFT_232139 [Plenodomus tracheiphilus IPT5]